MPDAMLASSSPSTTSAAATAVLIILAFANRKRLLALLDRYRSEESRTERHHTTQLSSLLNARAPPCTAEPMPNACDGVLLRHLLTHSECTALIAAAEKYGFGTTAYDKEYRGNLRLMTEDADLSTILWRRLQPHLPAEVQCSLDGSMWRADGLCSTWKWSKYLPKPGRDAFAPHVDGTHWPEPAVRSFFSLNVYLNHDFEAGRTRFYRSTTSDEVEYACQPEAGLALIFRQPPSARYLHDGEPVRSGVKYLWRCDVMYRKA